MPKPIYDVDDNRIVGWEKEMNLNDFQLLAMESAIYPNKGNNLTYPVLGLCGESGEVAEKVKKILRDDNGIVSFEKRELIIKELGDVLWYIAAIAFELNVNLNFIAEKNLSKLNSRKERGVLGGSGDAR